MTRPRSVLVLNGPNLNLLGQREPEIYGHQTLAGIEAQLAAEADVLGLELELEQTNHEGVLIDRIQAASGRFGAVLLNAGGYTHTSVALRDAVAAVRGALFVVEVHLSVPGAREPFRHSSVLVDVVDGRIEGFGALSYVLALRAASALLRPRGVDRDQ